ncbi:MAG TPA: ferredoxin--NADP reductase [Adhaeribacter sp.]|nr:ferredoxin--NADP reductase [Adhaeribacter sp.]
MTNTLPEPANYQKLTISKIREEIPGFKTFTFAEENTANLNYEAGQYLTLVKQTAAGEIRRSYSITSAPTLSEPLTIGVKRVVNGIFSRFLVDEAQPGDELLVSGTGGFFVLPPTVSEVGQLFFLAAGSGITPVFSLLKTALVAYPELPVVLIYSNASPEKTIFRQELLALAARYPDRLQIGFLFSNSPDLSRARLYKGLLQELVKEHARVPPQKILAYVCGPENYMRMCTYGLHLSGIPLENIRKENFSTQKVNQKIAPPDTDAHEVFLQLKDRHFRFTSQYPETILQAARKAGLNFPYSCEAGRCGNCAIKCTSGTVWMSYNEVLTERDLEKGLVLTCTGFPVGGDVRLELS